jgi:uncharacterized membrane protein
MNLFLLGAGLLHAAFMGAELFPWPMPVLLSFASKKLPKLPSGEKFTDEQLKLVATIVHNAGVYNGILAAGLFYSAFAGSDAILLARVLLAGALAAGTFGAATLKSPVPALQAAVGLAGLAFV